MTTKYNRAKWQDNSDGTMSLETNKGKGMVIPLFDGMFKIFIHNYLNNEISWHTRSLERNAKTIVHDAIKIELEFPDSELPLLMKKLSTLSYDNQCQALKMMGSALKSVEINDIENKTIITKEDFIDELIKIRK